MRTPRIAIAATFLSLATTMAGADEDSSSRGARSFEISITNVTRGISFTPLLVATHSTKVSVFTPGQVASDELALLAESGATAPLKSVLEASGESLDSVATSGLLQPGATVKVTVRANNRSDRLSIAGMLLPTNDGFVGLRGAELPWDYAPYSVALVGYDAGSEPNDERCQNIPGPHCGGVGASPGVGGEGFVHVHSGIHGIADLNAATYDWRNPVAIVTIRRIR